jgi:hypothetical protein
MLVGTIKKSVAAYFRRSVVDFVVEGVDLLLEAMNEARHEAELLNDFNAQFVTADLAMVPSGVNIEEATVNGQPVKLKELSTFFLSDASGGLVPLHHHTRKHDVNWSREQLEFSLYNYGSRYPGNREEMLSQQSGGLRRPEVFLAGNVAYLKPASEVAMKVDGFAWMKDWLLDNETDWFITQGQSYLKWASICSLNYRDMRFVNGLDGNLGPPVKARDNALASLVAWDAMRNQSGRSPRGTR